MTEFSTPVLQGSTRLFSVVLSVLAAQVSTITFTLVDADENILNARDAVSVRNENNGTLTNNAFSLLLTAGDTALSSGDVSRVQTRYIHLVFTLVGGAVERYEAVFYVTANHIPG
jgi:hypothetical protein